MASPGCAPDEKGYKQYAPTSRAVSQAVNTQQPAFLWTLLKKSTHAVLTLCLVTCCALPCCYSPQPLSLHELGKEHKTRSTNPWLDSKEKRLRGQVLRNTVICSAPSPTLAEAHYKKPAEGVSSPSSACKSAVAVIADTP